MSLDTHLQLQSQGPVSMQMSLNLGPRILRERPGRHRPGDGLAGGTEEREKAASPGGLRLWEAQAKRLLPGSALPGLIPGARLCAGKRAGRSRVRVVPGS